MVVFEFASFNDLSTTSKTKSSTISNRNVRPKRTAINYGFGVGYKSATTLAVHSFMIFITGDISAINSHFPPIHYESGTVVRSIFIDSHAVDNEIRVLDENPTAPAKVFFRPTIFLDYAPGQFHLAV